MKELFEKIQLVDFPQDQYYRQITPKKQIYLHHTVSNGNNSMGDINYWKSTSSRISTHVIIDKTGVIWQLYSSRFWGHHLGIKSKIFRDLNLPRINTKLNKESLGIELDSLGPVDKDGNSIAYGSRLTTDSLIEYPDKYRGYQYFEKYTNQQLESLQLLLRYWVNKYDISKKYNQDMWKISPRALTGENGIWTHTSVRPDKSDCHPQPELIEILKSI